MARKDPRLLLTGSRSLNDELWLRSVRHSVFLERLKTGQVDQVLKLLDKELFPDLLRSVAGRLAGIAVRGHEVGFDTTRRLAQMAKSVDTMMRAGLNSASDTLRSNLSDIALNEAEYQAAIVNQGLKALQVEYVVPSLATIKAAVFSRPFQGKVLKDWWSEKVDRSARGAILSSVRQGVNQGQSVDQIVARLRGTSANQFGDGTIGAIRNRISAVVRTAVNHTTAAARHTTYEENPDLVEKWVFVATLDSRTTLQCQSLDGTVWDVGEGPLPPVHYGCRSGDAPVVKSAADIGRELGISLRDLPPGERASIDGAKPATMTYPEFLKTQPAWFQDLALKSHERGVAFRAGEISIDGYESDLRKFLTPNQVRSLEGLSLN